MSDTTFREYPQIEQGTEAWHEVRRGVLTASVVGQLVTAKTFKPAANDTSRALTALLVAERITGYTEPTHMSDDMWRGIEDEPRARALYSEHYAPVEESGFMTRTGPGWTLGFSPDGKVGNGGLIEVKSRRQKKHLQTILANEVPAENMAQIQTGLLVSGRDWCDYISYAGGMPMYVKRVWRDERWFAALIDAARLFELNAAEMTSTYLNRVADLHPTERPIDLDEMRIS